MSAPLPCPCCGQPAPPECQRGLFIVRRASIGSDIVGFERQLASLSPTNERAQYAVVHGRLERERAELVALHAEHGRLS